MITYLVINLFSNIIEQASKASAEQLRDKSACLSIRHIATLNNNSIAVEAFQSTVLTKRGNHMKSKYMTLITLPILITKSILQRTGSEHEADVKPVKSEIHPRFFNFRLSIVATSVLGLLVFSATANSANNANRALSMSTQQKVSAKHAENTLLVKFKTGSTISRVTAISALANGKRSKPRNIPGLKIPSLAIPGKNTVVAGNQWQKITYPAGANLAAIIDQLSKVAEVEYVQPDYLYNASATPNDPLYTIVNPYTEVTDIFPDLQLLWGIKQVNAPAAWDKTTGNSGLVVAVIDSGIKLDHEDLIDNLWKNPDATAPDQYGYDFVRNDPIPDDEHGHGTHVAGTIAAQGNNALGVAGVAWDVQIMSLKVISREGWGQTSNFIAAIEYADSHNVQLSNNSWGGVVFDLALYETMQRSQQLFLVAAGNSNFDNDRGDLVFPYGGIAYPASFDLPNIISIAATDPDNFGSFFSNWGITTVDIGAPGNHIWSTAISRVGCTLCSSVEYPGYAQGRGTSMATPHVTGAAALLYSKYGSAMSPSIAKTLLLQSANTFRNNANIPLGWLILTGVMDIDKALTSPFLLTSDVTQKTLTSPGTVQFTINGESFNGGSGSLQLSLHSRETYITGTINKSSLSIQPGAPDSAVVTLNIASGYPIKKGKVEVVATNPIGGKSYTVSLVVNTTVDTDLVVTSVSAVPAPATVNNGDYLDVTSTIKNQGTVPVPDGQQFSVGYVISPDTHISPWDANLTGETNVIHYFDIAPGQSVTTTDRVLIPYDFGGLPIEKGSMYIGAIVDINSAITEVNETNNTGIAPDKITIADQSDLIVTSVTTATSNLQPGDRFDVTTTVKNIGITGANKVCWGVYISDDITIVPFIDKAINTLGRICINGVHQYLAKGASYTRTATVQIPSNQPQKTYYLGAYVDPYGDVPETNENNNGYALSTITVGNVTGPVNHAPTAGISGPSTGKLNTSLSFTSTSSDPDGDAMTYLWDFGDGSATQTAATVSHAYTSSGNKTVTLTATDSGGLFNTTTHTVYIDSPPTASLTGPNSGNTGVNLTFSGSGSSDPEGAISNYAWTFGDGASANGSSSSASHIYNTAGTYSVVLTVTDSVGQTATTSKSITISTAQTPQPPTAVISGPSTGEVGATLFYNGSGSSDPEGGALSYSWNFGDGSATAISTAANPSHTYNAAGSFNISLVVTDNQGLTSSAQQTVTITAPPPPPPPPSGSNYFEPVVNYNDPALPIKPGNFIRVTWVGPKPPTSGYSLALYSSSNPTAFIIQRSTLYMTYDTATNTGSMSLYVTNKAPLGSAFVKFISTLSNPDPTFTDPVSGTFEIVK